MANIPLGRMRLSELLRLEDKFTANVGSPTGVLTSDQGQRKGKIVSSASATVRKKGKKRLVRGLSKPKAASEVVFRLHGLWVKGPKKPKEEGHRKRPVVTLYFGDLGKTGEKGGSRRANKIRTSKRDSLQRMKGLLAKARGASGR